MRIERLAALPNKPDKVSVRFDDGTALTVSLDLVAEFGLYAGLTLSDERFAALRAAVTHAEARRLAANFLAVRPHSRKELIDKLCRREIDTETAERAAERMAELGYLDDAQYAQALAESYARRGYGRRRLENELWRRGVAKDDWPEEDTDQDETERAIDAFLQTKLKGRAPDEADRRRLSAALARRGFGWGDISAAFRRLAANETE